MLDVSDALTVVFNRNDMKSHFPMSFAVIYGLLEPEMRSTWTYCTANILESRDTCDTVHYCNLYSSKHST